MAERLAEKSMTEEERLRLLLAAAPSLIAWFAENARVFPWRKGRTPYMVLVSETMLQQTRIEAVLKYYDRFMRAFPTLGDLARAPEEKVLKLWEGLGYYSRARNLKKTAEICLREHGGELPERFDDLRKLPGIGDYSAGAIASLCFDEAVPAVDGNVLRVLARLFGDARDVRLPQVKKEAERTIAALFRNPSGERPKSPAAPAPSAKESSISPARFNEAVMELGETLCAPKGKPQCGLCPLKDVCAAHAAGTEEQLPFRSAGRERVKEEKTVWVLTCGGKTALEKRTEPGLLHGMYGFPMTDGKTESTEEAEEKLLARGIVPLRVEALGAARHVFTHKEWLMQGYLAETAAPLPGLNYVTAEELEKTYALPAAFRAYKEQIREIAAQAPCASRQ